MRRFTPPRYVLLVEGIKRGGRKGHMGHESSCMTMPESRRVPRGFCRKDQMSNGNACINLTLGRLVPGGMVRESPGRCTRGDRSQPNSFSHDVEFVPRHDVICYKIYVDILDIDRLIYLIFADGNGAENCTVLHQIQRGLMP